MTTFFAHCYLLTALCKGWRGKNYSAGKRFIVEFSDFSLIPLLADIKFNV
jgi:hypothetical protein